MLICFVNVSIFWLLRDNIIEKLNFWLILSFCGDHFEINPWWEWFKKSYFLERSTINGVLGWLYRLQRIAFYCKKLFYREYKELDCHRFWLEDALSVKKAQGRGVVFPYTSSPSLPCTPTTACTSLHGTEWRHVMFIYIPTFHLKYFFL